MHRWLITGARGQLGSHVAFSLAAAASVSDRIFSVGQSCASGLTHSADLRSASELRRLLREVQPTRILHLAAIASPATAALDPCSARALHVAATRELADYCRASGAWMLFASSDFVWSGAGRRRRSERERPCPKTIYGETKLRGEDVVLENDVGLVLRYSLLCGLPAQRRVTTWTKILSRLLRHEPVRAVDDELRSPIGLMDAARATAKLARRQQRGLVHVAGGEVVSPYELIDRLRARLGSASKLIPIARSQLYEGLERPQNTAQSNQKLMRCLPDFRIDDLIAGFLPLKDAA